MSTASRRVGQEEFVTSSAARLEIPHVTSGVVAVVRPTFEDVYEEHFDLVWRTARRLGVPESAVDDVVQDAFLVLHRRLPEYDGRASMKAWLLGITVRVVADHRRRYRRKESHCEPTDEDAIVSSMPAPIDEVEQAESVRLLADILSQLDEDKREILVLRQLEEMTVPEIAEVLRANVNTIYARLRAARREFEAAYARHRARERRAP